MMETEKFLFSARRLNDQPVDYQLLSVEQALVFVQVSHAKPEQKKTSLIKLLSVAILRTNHEKQTNRKPWH